VDTETRGSDPLDPVPNPDLPVTLVRSCVVCHTLYEVPTARTDRTVNDPPSPVAALEHPPDRYCSEACRRYAHRRLR